MSIRYYDAVLGRERIKRRYLWSAASFAAGVIAGLIAARLL